MKFTLSWLKDHLDTSASLAEICEALTKIGLEVEAVDDPAHQGRDHEHGRECDEPGGEPRGHPGAEEVWREAENTDCGDAGDEERHQAGEQQAEDDRLEAAGDHGAAPTALRRAAMFRP